MLIVSYQPKLSNKILSDLRDQLSYELLPSLPFFAVITSLSRWGIMVTLRYVSRARVASIFPITRPCHTHQSLRYTRTDLTCSHRITAFRSPIWKPVLVDNEDNCRPNVVHLQARIKRNLFQHCLTNSCIPRRPVNRHKTIISHLIGPNARHCHLTSYGKVHVDLS